MKTIKFWDIPAHVKELEFDGDKTDFRLHNRDLPYWGVETEEEYKTISDRINTFTIQGNGWTAYSWLDISGFDYWHLQMEEDNYCQLTFAFDGEDINESEVTAIQEAIDAFNYEFSDLTPIH